MKLKITMKPFLLFLNTILLVSLLISCKDDLHEEISVEQEIQVEETIIPVTYPLYKESIHNQRSGIVWRYGDDSNNPPNMHINGMNSWGLGHIYHDVNNDGFQDILVSNLKSKNTYTTYWYINQGDNHNFKESDSYNLGSLDGLNASKILKTDVNNDDLADFILVGNDINGNGFFVVLKQIENQSWEINRIQGTEGMHFLNASAGDLNSDGNVDVVTSDVIWDGDGNGNFINKNFNLNIYCSPLWNYEIIDINQDGLNDIYLSPTHLGVNPQSPVGAPYPGRIIINGGNGFTFQNISQNQIINRYLTSPRMPLDVEFMDVDNDGVLDVIESIGVLSEDGESWSSKLFVSYQHHVNDGTTFGAASNGTILTAHDGNYVNGVNDRYGWSRFKIDDIDGDGVLDIVPETYHDGNYNGLKNIDEKFFWDQFGPWLSWIQVMF